MAYPHVFLSLSDILLLETCIKTCICCQVLELKKQLESAEAARDDYIKQLHDARRELQELKLRPGGSPLSGLTILVDLDNTVRCLFCPLRDQGWLC